MSKSLTERLARMWSRARSAPTSYETPVTPPLPAPARSCYAGAGLPWLCFTTVAMPLRALPDGLAGKAIAAWVAEVHAIRDHLEGFGGEEVFPLVEHPGV